ncbi:metal-dependent hydrolase [Methanosphaerula palustris]|uniref:Membrane-bound metal-dependent hydrolase n=1 Tax=Methanosphaerula palustris (strain ATCC BAA-1556 / DSM 19958 / E1-9c) TaxID=521011 RepID=B8GEX0_METPE|nr:metal-dependent hydrolase [Methanosphaerula palustris]ACL15937.1 membrane-bound metal-dependent hydrolase [Methanosphaerula palustris E1-9c]
MFFFIHLFIGVLLGYLLSRFSGRHLLLPCAFGAVLPDLVDKPLGYLILGTIVDGGGRIYTHGLLFLGLLFLIGALLLYWTGRADLVAMGVGVLSHQLLDLMWLQPINWLYPFLGPYPTVGIVSDYFLNGFIREISSPPEWVMGFISLLVIFFYVRRNR